MAWQAVRPAARSQRSSLASLAVSALAIGTALVLTGAASVDSGRSDEARAPISRGDESDEARLAELPGDESDHPEHREAAALVMAEHPQLSESEAFDRVLGQGDAMMLLEEIGARHADVYGGSWYDSAEDIQHVVVTSRGVFAAIEALAAKHGVRTELHMGALSLDELNRIGSDLQEGRVEAVPAITEEIGELWTDVAANGWTLALNPSAEAEGIAEAVRRTYAGLVDVTILDAPAERLGPDVCTSRLACGRPARSGIVLRVNGVNTCSLGYRASASDGSKWVFTAGHCGMQNDVVGHGRQSFGPIRLRTFSVAGFDFARARVDNSCWLATGWELCLNAWHSQIGVSCGTVTEVNTSSGLVRANTHACADDGGGAWTWHDSTGRHWAIGLHVRSTRDGSHAPGGSSSFYSVPRINQFNNANSLATVRIEVRS